MKTISLQLQTIYADLVENMDEDGVRPGSISRRRIKGAVHLYAIEKDGVVQIQRYLGPEKNPGTAEKVALVQRSSALAKIRRSSIAALKGAGISAPTVDMGRLLEALANAGLFHRGVVLIGTAAYQLYPCLVGAHLSGGALRTQDADLGLTQLAMRSIEDGAHLDEVLRRADPTYRPKFHRAHDVPFKFQADSGFTVEVLTTLRRSADPIRVKGLGCAAQPLPFLDYLLDESIWAVALYGTGVRVRVPDPARFAVHKLIVAHERPAGAAKRRKDLLQAEELIEALRLQRSQIRIEKALESARKRRPKWRRAIASSLAEIETHGSKR